MLRTYILIYFLYLHRERVPFLKVAILCSYVFYLQKPEADKPLPTLLNTKAWLILDTIPAKGQLGGVLSAISPLDDIVPLNQGWAGCGPSGPGFLL